MPQAINVWPVDQSGIPSAYHPGYWLFVAHKRFVLCSEKTKHRLSFDLLPPSLCLVYSAQIEIWARAKAPNVLPQNYASKCLQTIWEVGVNLNLLQRKH